MFQLYLDDKEDASQAKGEAATCCAEKINCAQAQGWEQPSTLQE